MILACHNIKKAFGEEVIVSGGSFHIEDHEKAALVGPNGAGKTTLLKMIVGEIQADGGNVVLTRGKTMGYLAQHQDMNNDHTIYQEVRTAKADILDMERQIREIEQEMKHLSGERLEERMNTYQRLTAAFERENGYACESEITGVLKGLGFTEEEFAKPVATLSGGQKTRVSLGKLLLTKPDILLLDEPMANLDPVVKTDIWELLIRTIEKENISIIISTHLVEEVNDITDYIGLLDNGRFVKFGDREQILNDDLGNKNKNLRELLEEENG